MRISSQGRVLLLIRTCSDELFYHLGLRQFGAFGKITLQPQPSLRELLEIAVDGETGLEAAGLDPEQVVQGAFSKLFERREMLAEYFGFGITDEGCVDHLPSLLPGYVPSMDRLPYFVLCAGVRVSRPRYRMARTYSSPL